MQKADKTAEIWQRHRHRYEVNNRFCQELEEAGLVKSQKVGRVRTCSLEMGAIAQLEAWISERRRFWEQQYDQLEAYLAETAPKEGDR